MHHLVYDNFHIRYYQENSRNIWTERIHGRKDYENYKLSRSGRGKTKIILFSLLKFKNTWIYFI